MSRKRQTIHEYITIVRATAERQTGGMVNLQEMDNKPDSEPPLNDRALRLTVHTDNWQTGTIIEPAIRMMADLAPDLYTMVRRATDDPAGPDRWKQGHQRGYEGDAEDSILYGKALSWLVRYCERWYPGRELHVAYDPDDQPAANKKDASNIKKRHRREDTYRHLYSEWCKAVESGIPAEQAKIEVAKANETYPTKVREAVAHCREGVA